MHKVLLYALLLICACCRNNIDEFRPYSYDGEYPRMMTGDDIKTYKSTILNGTIDVLFNSHTWNHAPYLSVNAAVIDPALTNISQPQLSVSVGSLLSNEPIDLCLTEKLYLRIPLQEGRFVFTNALSPNDEVTARFYSINCDATKDVYQLNSLRENWVNVKRFDAISRVVEAEFDVTFIIQ